MGKYDILLTTFCCKIIRLTPSCLCLCPLEIMGGAQQLHQCYPSLTISEEGAGVLYAESRGQSEIWIYHSIAIATMKGWNIAPHAVQKKRRIESMPCCPILGSFPSPSLNLLVRARCTGMGGRGVHKHGRSSTLDWREVHLQGGRREAEKQRSAKREASAADQSKGNQQPGLD